MHFDKSKATLYLETLQGYKLSNVHFKVGAQYHTNSFIHARVLLQNSYYSARIALLLAEKISIICAREKLLEITLVGYERYSELLLGLIIYFLQSLEPKITISSCIMIDDDGMKSVVSRGKPFQDFFIIVPIVSTGNTAKRIELAYINENHFSTLVKGKYHVLRLCPPTIHDDVDSLLRVSVDWHSPHNCPLCYDTKVSIPLLETDKTQLNPIAIFGSPTIKDTIQLEGKEWKEWKEWKPVSEFDEKKKKVSVYGCPFGGAKFNNSLQYHKDRKLKDFRTFSHLTSVFIDENKKGIEEWLGKLVHELPLHSTDRVYILSPCHEMTNIPFVNLVNDKLFGASASIIYIEPSIEYPENFKKLHSAFLKDVKEEKAKLFYVDDDLVSGNSFFSVYDLFRFAADYDHKVVLSASIFLMNKANPNVNDRVTRASGIIHSYVSINMPQQYLVSEVDPYSREIKRYERVLGRVLYYEPELDIKGKYISLLNPSVQMEPIQERKQRHLEMFFATHVLHEIFSQLSSKQDLDALSFDQLIELCAKKESKIKDKYAVLKVLTTNSFTMYKPIRERVFEWVKSEMTGLKDSIAASCVSGKWDSPKLLEHLLFMIHRSVSMGNLQIVSAEFFSLLSTLFTAIPEEGKLMGEKSDVFSTVVPKDFSLHLMKRYVELICSHPAAAFHIKVSLSAINVDNQRWQRFKNELLDETSSVLNDLYDTMLARGFSETLIEHGSEFVTDNKYERLVKEWFKQSQIGSTSSFIVTSKVFSFPQSGLPTRFIYYLWVKSYIASDRKKALHSKEYVEKKTTQLCQQLKHVFSPTSPVGCFFIVTDILGQHRLVFDENEKGYSVLTNRFVELTRQPFFKELNLGIGKETAQVCLEYKGDESTNPFKQFIDCNILQLYRLGKIDDTSLSGLIGFYYKNREQFDLYGRRYILLLRRDIINFIELHHKNEEFIQSIVAEEKRKFAYLTGHGREMMLRLVVADRKFLPYLTTLERLQGIFAGSQIEQDNVLEQLDSIFARDMINRTKATSIARELKTIAKLIYEKETVEWAEEPDYERFGVQGRYALYFSPQLLKYICFELLINAKKNRFIIAPNAYEDAYSQEETPFTKNTIGLSISLDSQATTVTVIGTGPKVEDRIFNSINYSSQIKKKGDTSGLDLIKKLLNVYDSQNCLKMECSAYSSSSAVWRNSVSVIISTSKQ